MSDETSISCRENNVITRQEKKHPNKKIFVEFNKVFVSGRIETEPVFSHETLWGKFYQTRIRVKRLSGTEDFIPIIVSDLLIETMSTNSSLEGKWVEATGQFRSHNQIGEDGIRHLKLFVYITTINIYDYESEMKESANEDAIYLDGYLCKKPVFRKTPFGRHITDLHIAVNRPYGQADYIPCITWGRDAQWAASLKVGDRVALYGRIQSRIYFKRCPKNSNGEEERVAYEISVICIKKVENPKLKK